MPKKTEDWNTARTRAELATKFAPPGWAMFYEVADATGARQRRWADAVAMSLWPSKGLELHGFEIKVSRSDWLHELKKPEKAEAIQQYCDRWWLVAGNPRIVQLSELPSTWGLIERSGQKLRVVRQPEKLNAREITRDFLAALLRRAHEADEHARHKEIGAEVERRLEEEVRRATWPIQREADNAKEQLDRIRGQIQQLEEATGLPLGRGLLSRFGDRQFPPDKVGNAIRLLLEHEHQPIMQQISDTLDSFINRVGPLMDRAHREQAALSLLLDPEDNRSE